MTRSRAAAKARAIRLAAYHRAQADIAADCGGILARITHRYHTERAAEYERATR